MHSPFTGLQRFITSCFFKNFLIHISHDVREMILVPTTEQYISNLLYKNFVFTTNVRSQFFKTEWSTKKNDCRTLITPHVYILPHYIFHVKWPITKIEPRVTVKNKWTLTWRNWAYCWDRNSRAWQGSRWRNRAHSRNRRNANSGNTWNAAWEST